MNDAIPTHGTHGTHGRSAPMAALPPDGERPPGGRKRRGITLVPFVGDLVAMTRLLRDRGAPLWAKLFTVASFLYVVMPFDLSPDIAPIIGWLDDVGLVVVLRLLMYRQVEPYRYPLFAKRLSAGTPPSAPPAAP